MNLEICAKFVIAYDFVRFTNMFMLNRFYEKSSEICKMSQKS